MLLHQTKNLNKFKALVLDGEEVYQLERLSKDQLKICDQNIFVNNRTQTITVDYDRCLMSGFQFRKLSHKLQYRWFKINTINRKLINGDWGTI